MRPQGESYLPLDSPTSQGPRAFVVNPTARHSACVGRHSPLLTRSPRSHLVPRCRLWRLPPVLLSLSCKYNWHRQRRVGCSELMDIYTDDCQSRVFGPVSVLGLPRYVTFRVFEKWATVARSILLKVGRIS